MDYATQQSLTYTTLDEINFLRELEREGKRGVLRSYRRTIALRRWDGEGMRVNVAEVMRELDRILGKESGSQPAGAKGETIEKTIGRMATEWLEGGHLQAAAQKRAVAGKS